MTSQVSLSALVLSTMVDGIPCCSIGVQKSSISWLFVLFYRVPDTVFGVFIHGNISPRRPRLL